MWSLLLSTLLELEFQQVVLSLMPLSHFSIALINIPTRTVHQITARGTRDHGSEEIKVLNTP